MDTQRTTSKAAGIESSTVGSLQPAQYDQVAKAASAGIMTHRQVESAVVEISGSAGQLTVHLRCTLKSEGDASGAIDHISEGLIPGVEQILGEDFASRDLNFTVAA